MSGFWPLEAATLLDRARRARPRTPLTRLPPGVHPETLEQGVAAQLAVAQLQGEAPPAGFKIGATAPRMQEYLGLSGPAAAFMAEAGLHASGSTLAIDGFLGPGVECELAVHLGRDLPPGPCTPAQAREAVDELMAAIEIVENRYVDLAEFGAAAMLADQVFHAGAVVAEAYPGWRELDLQTLAGSIVVNGVERDRGLGRDLLGDPMRALAWLAGSAEVAAFGGLKRGQLIMLGSVCPPIWLDRPARVEVSFPPLASAKVELVT